MAIRSAKGTLVQLGDLASPPLFTTIGQVRSVTGPSTKAIIQDVTTHSTAGNWKEQLATLIDPGNMTFPINYDSADATHAFATGLWQQLINLTENDFKCVLPGANGTMLFNGFIASHSFTLPVDNVIQAAIEILINGAIVATNP